MDEQRSGTTSPDAAEMDTLLKEGAPGKKKFSAWFKDKVISNPNKLLCNF
jgi:hypothetical protein